METVNSLTSAASRVIWGDPNKNKDPIQKEEPLSGETGDVNAGEPYDKGNAEPTSTPADTDSANPTTSSTTDTNTSTSTMPSESTKSDMPGNTSTTMPIRSEHETSKTGVTSSHNPTSSNNTSGAGPTPSVDADPSSAPQDTQKQQGADRPADEPAEGSEEHDRIAATKREAEDAADIDTSGPGPKPLSEVNGGATAKGNDGEDGPQKESHGEGTGEKYVKSSGVKADGGDVDAANAGAGKEADRLLEQKGVHREVPSETTSEDISNKTDSKDTSESSGGKLSGLKEKVKAKLHKN